MKMVYRHGNKTKVYDKILILKFLTELKQKTYRDVLFSLTSYLLIVSTIGICQQVGRILPRDFSQ